jgi:hypothetical protein
MKHVKLFEQFFESLNEGFKNTKDFEKFLEEIDGMGESQIKKIMGRDYIDTPGFYSDEKDDYDGIIDFMTSNMGKSDFEKLKKYWETKVAESINESNKFSDAFSVLDFFGGALPNDYNKARAVASKAGYDLPTSLYDQAAQMAQDGETEDLHEGRIAIKHVYSNAPVRNKVLELLKSGKISESDFMAAVSKAGAPSKWLQRNSQYFKIEEENGVKFYSLSKSGETIVNSQLNEAFGNRAGLTKEETLALAQKVADAISKIGDGKCTVNKKTLEEDSFDLDIDGEEYAGGSYSLYDNGNIVNHAIGNSVKEPIYGNWKKDDVNAIAKKIKAIDAQLNEANVEIFGDFEIDENLIVDPLDVTKDFFYVSINGTVYGYQAKSGGNAEDLANTFKGMLKYSAGKALAWLKKNAELVSGSKKAIQHA